MQMITRFIKGIIHVDTKLRSSNRISLMKTKRVWHGKYKTMLICLVWLNRSSTLLRQSMYRDLLLPVHPQHVRNTAAAHITNMKYCINESLHSRSIQVELGKVEGFWSTLQLLQQALDKHLNVEQRAHWLLIQKEPISCALWWCHYVSLC